MSRAMLYLAVVIGLAWGCSDAGVDDGVEDARVAAPADSGAGASPPVGSPAPTPMGLV